MTKKKGLKVGSMSDLSEEEIRMSGIYDTHYYNYRCRDCGYEAKVEDIVVDSFPPSPRSSLVGLKGIPFQNRCGNLDVRHPEENQGGSMKELNAPSVRTLKIFDIAQVTATKALQFRHAVFGPG